MGKDALLTVKVNKGGETLMGLALLFFNRVMGGSGAYLGDLAAAFIAPLPVLPFFLTLFIMFTSYVKIHNNI